MTNENKHKQTTQMEYSHMAGSGIVYDRRLRHGGRPHHARSESGSPPSAASRRNSKRHTPCQYNSPSSGGVSRNEYETFNVPDKGAILNNSYTLSKTELAGYVQGNNNMAERPAKIIVNEVTGAGPTSMDGFLEVAGNRADVVIANPNGITVNGGGFINTGKAFLTTGKPVYDGEDHLQRFDITGGDILIEGKGLGGKETESLAILSRAVKINAGIWAKDLHITTGANTVDAKTLEASAIEGKEDAPPSPSTPPP